MADFDLTQTDAQVQSILNDGQNMQGAGAQTTLTTESVLLKDVNGNYHKILKSSFTEAIRDTLAGLLVNNDKGTTINQIAAIASGDFGSITPANLASVLGAFANAVTLSNNVTWDSLTSTCFVQAMGNNGGVPSSMLYGIGLCIVNSTKGIQVYIPNSADLFIYIRQRWDGAWASSWKKVAYTYPQ